ncbi:MAG TPA: hypothetical protein VMT61_07915 [Candidatus Binataceae bacterium]|nr:hypothetical protein [Candidatus Binataceae bacterium]
MKLHFESFRAVEGDYSRASANYIPLLLALAVVLGGCFYPPQEKPQPTTPRLTSVTLKLPYDMAWDTVKAVVENNGYRTIRADPNDGTLEAETVGTGFTLEDADCGKVRGIGRTIDAEPDLNSSAVYDFHVATAGTESSIVSVEATFTAPLHVPLHPTKDVTCTSRGRQEARLMEEVKAEALKQRRPVEHAVPDILKNPQ